MTSKRREVLRYYKSCLEEEIAWRARVTLGTRFTRYLAPRSRKEWVFSGVSDLKATVQSDRESFFKELAQTKTSRALFYGYPLFLSRAEAGKRPSLLPVLLFQLSWNKKGNTVTFTLGNERPAVNEDFLSTVFSSQEERSAFVERLQIDLWEKIDAASFMRSICNSLHDELDAIIVDTLDPEAVRRDFEPMKEEPGIYNKGAIVFAERQRINASVVRELDFLANPSLDSQFATTAAHYLFDETVDLAARSRPKGLARVCPLNEGQKDAVSAAFAEPLAVVTGPPGTGKSQTILAVLANAFLKGQRVVLTSRNNRAVDVVEERLNRLAAAPIAMRVGSASQDGGGRAGLIEFLTDALSATYSESRKNEYREAKEAFYELQRELFTKKIGADATIKQIDRRIAELEGKFGIESLARVPVKPQLLNILPNMAQIARSRAQETKSWLWRIANYRSEQKEALWFERQAKVLFGYWPDLEMPQRSVVSHRAWGEWALALERAGEIAFAANEIAVLRERKTKTLARAETTSALADLGPVEEMRLAEAAAAFIRASVKSIPDRLDDEGRRTLSEYRSALVRLEEATLSPAGRNQVMAEIMRHFLKISHILPIWCVTNLSVRNHIPLQAGLFDLAVIDEASQCDIASAVPVLYRAKAATIIGDPHQLRHVSRLTPQRSSVLAARAGLDSQTGNAYDYQANSLFDLALARTHRKPVFLAEHYRSHPDIVSFSNGWWYHDRLQVKTDLNALLVPEGFRAGVSWHDVAGETLKAPAGGAYNKSEAAAAARLAAKIMADGTYRGSIGIVTPFRAQANLIVELLRDRMSLDQIERHDLVVDTVHGFQGDERDVIIFSTCLSRGMPAASSFFLSRTENLFNVALTRPRAVLVVLGDHGAAAALDIPHIRAFAKKIETEGWLASDPATST